MKQFDDRGLSNSSECVECPLGAVCDKGGQRLEFVLSEEGWFRARLDTETWYPCQSERFPGACQGGLPMGADGAGQPLSALANASGVDRSLMANLSAQCKNGACRCRWCRVASSAERLWRRATAPAGRTTHHVVGWWAAGRRRSARPRRR